MVSLMIHPKVIFLSGLTNGYDIRQDNHINLYIYTFRLRKNCCLDTLHETSVKRFTMRCTKK